jgi:hypothetical protein
MPHFKCVACRTRLHSAAAPADVLGDLCPRCGSPLEPVGELAEIVGFQSIRQRNSPADDGGSFSPEAVAQAAALPKPEENP